MSPQRPRLRARPSALGITLLRRKLKPNQPEPRKRTGNRQPIPPQANSQLWAPRHPASPCCDRHPTLRTRLPSPPQLVALHGLHTPKSQAQPGRWNLKTPFGSMFCFRGPPGIAAFLCEFRSEPKRGTLIVGTGWRK